jgi:hypothetical protein
MAKVDKLPSVAGALYVVLTSMEFQEQSGKMIAIVDAEDLARLTVLMTELKAALHDHGINITKLNVVA